MPTKVYAYGCKHPREGSEQIDQQIWLGHRYYNKLIELHRKQMDECDELRRAKFPDFRAAEEAVANANEAIEAFLDVIRKNNARERCKSASAGDKSVLAELKKTIKDARAKRKEIRARIAGDAELQAALATIYEQTAEAKRQARATCGVYWGSYLRIEAAVDDAVKKTKGKPVFSKWKGDGQVAVQIQGGTSWQDIVLGRGKSANIIRAEPLPTSRTGRSARPWLFSIRISSTEDRKPVWAKVMGYVHRDLPDDAKIMWVSLVRKRLAPHRLSDGKFHTRYDWSIQFTFNTAEEKTRAQAGAVGIDLGWRLMDGTLRVAYWADDAGNKGELRLPFSLLQRWGKCRSLQSIRDRNFDAVRAGLADWLASMSTVPDWLAEVTKFMGQWKAKWKLVKVLDALCEHYPGASGEQTPDVANVIAELKAWREQDVHLWQWQVDNEKKAQRIRLHLYRNFAALIRTTYQKVAVEDCDWRKLARKPVATDESYCGSREYMRHASVGLLRSLLKQDGAVMIDSKDTTRIHHACGSLEDWDQAKDLVHRCSRCGIEFDQDHNAAINLLARAKVVDETHGTARDSDSDTATRDTLIEPKNGGKWARRKDGRSQRLAENDAET